MLDIQKLEVGPLDACCYIVSSTCSEAMIIDPGGDTERILDCLEQKKLHPVILINTHGHGDHIGANKELKEKFPDIKICIHTDDAEMELIYREAAITIFSNQLKNVFLNWMRTQLFIPDTDPLQQ